MANETKTEFDGDFKLRWRLHDEFHAFPRQMGWWKLVDLNAPNPAACAQAKAKAGGGGATTGPPPPGGGWGSSRAGAGAGRLDLRSPGVRLAVPALAKQGNVLEVILVCRVFCFWRCGGGIWFDLGRGIPREGCQEIHMYRRRNSIVLF